jgi:hypothetical protein
MITDEEQRAIDKAHGAVGMAERIAASAVDSLHRAEARLEDAHRAVEAAELRRAAAVAAAVAAEDELAARRADPLLLHPSSRGDVVDVDAGTAEGRGL